MGNQYIIEEGKTLDEAIQNGLQKLQLKKNQVDVTVLQEGKGFLGFQTANYKVMLSPKEDMTELKQKEDIFEDGRYEIKTSEEGKILHIFPPKGSGKQILLDDVIMFLKDNEIYPFNLEKLNLAMKKRIANFISIDDLQNDIPAGVQVAVEISKNEMEAYILIMPPKDEQPVTEKEIYDILASKSITKGIDETKIKEIIEEKQFFKTYKIASGKEAVNGIDGNVEYLFDTKLEIKPTILEDGRVDLKELNIIQPVSKGEQLAKRTLPTQGVDGFLVTGRTLKARDGRPAIFKKGKNVVETEDGLYLIADAAGQPKLIDGKVTVLEIYEVSGNVDNTTGNIRFNGKVIIKGNVRTGFTVECDGDAEIYGVVEGATISAGGNILLHKGIQGQNIGKLISKNDIIARYMESCHAKADGSINAEAIMHCNIESKATITVAGKKGLIVGGEIKASNEVNAKFIGSPMATVTRIEVGVDPEKKGRYEKLKNEEVVTKQNKNQVNQIIDMLKKMSKTAPLTKEKQALLEKSIHTESVLTKKLLEIKEELETLNSILMTLSDGKVNASATVYPGVQICIGNSIYYVRDEIQYTTFLKKEGEVQITSYLGNNGGLM